MNKKILILGVGGQLGTAWATLLGKNALPLAQKDIDFLDPQFIQKLEKKTAGLKLAAVINAAAYTAVDQAEGEGRADAMRINAEAVGELAAWCKKRKVPLVHYSTDYVFDGSSDAPRYEYALPRPLNAYGESKLAGERAVAEAGGKYLIFRTSWLYDAHGKNFFNTMLRLFKEKESLKVVSDQVGAPTYVPYLAEASKEALEHALALPDFPSGTYHLCSTGETSWHGFAEAIFALARTHDSGIRCRHIDPIPTAEYRVPAKRPLNSRLDCGKAEKALGVRLPDWEEGLRECFKEKYGSNRLLHSRP